MPWNSASQRLAVDQRSITRRAVLAVGASSGVVALSGCSTLSDAVGNLILKDVNVVNAADQSVAGTIEVTGPNGDTLRDERFDLVSQDKVDSGEEGNMAFYGDVLADGGEYTLSVTLDDGSGINGTTTAEGTVNVSEPDDEHVVALLGAGKADEPIVFTVVKKLSDLEEYDSDF